jgi:hypothetical protein
MPGGRMVGATGLISETFIAYCTTGKSYKALAGVVNEMISCELARFGVRASRLIVEFWDGLYPIMESVEKFCVLIMVLNSVAVRGVWLGVVELL